MDMVLLCDESEERKNWGGKKKFGSANELESVEAWTMQHVTTSVFKLNEFCNKNIQNKTTIIKWRNPVIVVIWREIENVWAVFFWGREKSKSPVYSILNRSQVWPSDSSVGLANVSFMLNFTFSITLVLNSTAHRALHSVIDDFPPFSCSDTHFLYLTFFL